MELKQERVAQEDDKMAVRDLGSMGQGHISEHECDVPGTHSLEVVEVENSMLGLSKSGLK